MDFKLDPETGDLFLPMQLVTGVDAVVQSLRIRLNLIRGTWALDTTAGTDWFKDALGKPVGGIRSADGQVKSRILTTNNVLSILTFTSQITTARRYIATFSCNTTFGKTGDITWQA